MAASNYGGSSRDRLTPPTTVVTRRGALEDDNEGGLLDRHAPALKWSGFVFAYVNILTISEQKVSMEVKHEKCIPSTIDGWSLVFAAFRPSAHNEH